MVNRDWGFSSLRLAAAAILVIAAFAKVWHYPLILKGDGFLANQIVLDAAIVFEAIAAVAIVASGAKLCWWMIVSVYGLFTIVSAFALLTDSECNCFGAWFGASVTMPLDLVILVACALIRIRNPNLLRISHSNSRLILFGISGSNDWSFHLDRLTLFGTPTGTVSWSEEPFVASPALFLLDRGLVQDAADGSDADSFASRLQLTH